MRSSALALLAVAIVAEVVATSALRASEGFTRLIPSVLVVLGYGISFYLLSLTLKTIPVGIVYAVWSGVGIVLITLVGAVVFKQIPDLPGVLGMALIIAGVVVLNMFSKVSMH
jgi:small multidrug resistance pump